MAAVIALAVSCLLIVAIGTVVYLRRPKFGDLQGLTHLRTLSPVQFEKLLGEGFRRRGYSLSAADGSAGADGGVDLVLQQGGHKYFVQCRQWQLTTVGVKPLRDLFGVMRARRAVGGIFVSSGAYTPEAVAFARDSGIELIDGPVLEELVLDAQLPEPFLDPTVRKRQKTGIFLKSDLR